MCDLADEDDDLVPGVEDVGAVDNFLSQKLQEGWLREEVSILILLNRNNE